LNLAGEQGRIAARMDEQLTDANTSGNVVDGCIAPVQREYDLQYWL